MDKGIKMNRKPTDREIIDWARWMYLAVPKANILKHLKHMAKTGIVTDDESLELIRRKVNLLWMKYERDAYGPVGRNLLKKLIVEPLPDRVRGMTKYLAYYDEVQDTRLRNGDILYRDKDKVIVYKAQQVGQTTLSNSLRMLLSYIRAGIPITKPIIKRRSVGATTICMEALEMYYRSKGIAKDKSLYVYTKSETTKNTLWPEASAFTLNPLDFGGKTASTVEDVTECHRLSQDVI